MTAALSRPPIAIVGISALFPGRGTTDGLWTDILQGVDLIGDIPDTHWRVADHFDPDPRTPRDRTYCKRGAFVPPVPFDPLEFGIPPNVLAVTDSTQILALVMAKEVLEDAAGHRWSALDRSRISVILGLSGTTDLQSHMAGRMAWPHWVRGLQAHGMAEAEIEAVCDRITETFAPWHEMTFPGALGNVIAGRITNRLDLGGTNIGVDAACASTLAALAVATNELTLGHCDLAITGGVDLSSSPGIYVTFSKTPALSPTHDCRPFSANADGTVLGEGIGLFAVRRLADAERDGDHIYAVIHGIGTSSDGRATSIYAPRREGQVAALQRAYAQAGYGPETVTLIEAHGTGTKVGDVVEVASLRDVFGEAAPPQTCALGSIKSQLGHARTAAGAAGLFKTVMALHHRVLPPTLKVERPNDALDLDTSPFYLNTAARPWIADPVHPRRAGLSAFGFGGTNVHVALEEYTGSAATPPRVWTSPSELLLASAGSLEVLTRHVREVIARAMESESLATVARDSQASFHPQDEHRLAIVATTAAELAANVEPSLAMLRRDAPRVHASPARVFYEAGETGTRALAFLFAGQGSQYLGMGADLAVAFEAARAVWDAEARQREDAEALHRLVFPPPAFSDDERAARERRLADLTVTQPALAAVALSQLALLQRLGVRPASALGHSFGEVMALHAAGVFDIETTRRIARQRGRLMSAATARTEGAMVAVSADRATVAALLDATALPLTIANDNAPQQVVLSGAGADIAHAEAVLRERQIATRRLPVSAAFHSPLVSGSIAPFRQFLDSVVVAPPALPVFSNESASPYPDAADAIRDRLARHITQPVRFRDCVQAMYDAGARIFLEIGPGDVLTTLVPQCLGQRPHTAVALDRRGQHGLTSLWTALGRLAVAGVTVDIEALRQGTRLPRPQVRPVGSHVIWVDSRLPATSGVAPRPSSTDTPAAPPAEAPAGAQRRQAPPLAPVVTAPVPVNSPSSVTGHETSGHATVDAFSCEAALMQERFMRRLSESHHAYLDLIGRLSRVDAGRIDPGRTDSGRIAAAGTADDERQGAPWVVADQAMTEAPSLVPSLPTGPDAGVATVAAPASPEGSSAPVATILSRAALARLLLEVVAEKTGYPVDLLSLEMELEAGLGVDSIKRLEILSALRDRVPGFSETATVDPVELGKVKTLDQVVQFIASAAADRTAADRAAVDTDPTRAVPPAEPMDSQPPMDSQALSRYIPVLRPARAVGTPMRGLDQPGRIAILPDDTELAAALAQRLVALGVTAAVSAQPPADAAGVIFLGGLRSPDADADPVLAMHRSAFLAAKGVAEAFTARGGLFVTVQDSGGDFALSTDPGPRAWLSGLPALAKTLAQCWPAAETKAIDLARGDRSIAALADLLIEELFTGGGDVEVGLQIDGSRVVPSAQRCPHGEPGRLPCDRQSVILVSGGARGITAACLEALAQAAAPRLVLVGRTPLLEEPRGLEPCTTDAALKDALTQTARAAGARVDLATLGSQTRDILAVREIRETLRRLASAGSDAVYVSVDARDRVALAAALDPIRRRWGPFTGLIHAAGIVADKLVRDKPLEQFELVFTSKVTALASLLDVTRDDPLRLIALFSSISSKAPVAGQTDYAMANEVLNKVARVEAVRRGSSCRVRSLIWGPWDGGNMMTPWLRPVVQARIPLIPVPDGARFFVRELATEDTAVEVVVTASDPLRSDTEPGPDLLTPAYAAST